MDDIAAGASDSLTGRAIDQLASRHSPNGVVLQRGTPDYHCLHTEGYYCDLWYTGIYIVSGSYLALTSHQRFCKMPQPSAGK